MKGLLLFGFWIIGTACFSQEKEFLLKGRLLAPDSIPVENAYIINFRNLLAYPSSENGRFNIFVRSGDSLMISHISFVRKKIYADSIWRSPDIILEYDTLLLKQVDVGIDPEKQNKILEKNLRSIRNMDVIIYNRMNPGTNLVNQAMNENIKILRSEATSVSLLRFSPSQLIGKLFKRKSRK